MKDDTALDFYVTDHGSIVLLKPCTPAAIEWVDENLPLDAPYHGKSIAVERRHFPAIYSGIIEGGLVIA